VSVSQNRTVVHLLAKQAIPRTESPQSGQHLILETTPTLGIRLHGTDFCEEPADHGAEGGGLLGYPDSNRMLDPRDRRRAPHGAARRVVADTC
jgi:hypothetical protein